MTRRGRSVESQGHSEIRDENEMGLGYRHGPLFKCTGVQRGAHRGYKVGARRNFKQKCIFKLTIERDMHQQRYPFLGAGWWQVAFANVFPTAL